MPETKLIGTEKFTKAMRVLPSQMQEAAKKAFNIHGLRFLSKFTRQRLSGGRGVEKRSGSLAKSFNVNVIEFAGKMTLRVWSSSKYALMQEYGTAGLPGGVLKPKRTQYLAIPTNAAKTAAGVARERPKDITDLFFAKGRASGKPFLGKVEGGRVVAYFLLRKEVKFRGKLGLIVTWNKEAKKVIPLIDKAADSVLSKKYKRI